LDGVARDRLRRLGAVRCPSGVAEIDQVLVRERAQNGVEDGEAPDPGVEDADGGVAVHRGACPVCRTPRLLTSRGPRVPAGPAIRPPSATAPPSPPPSPPPNPPPASPPR